MNYKIYDRVISLIGLDNFNKIKDKTVLIVGLGGVGGTACEALFRCGFTNLVLIDFDKVDYSNLNRQILFNEKDVGELKSVCAKKHLDSINKDNNVITYNLKVCEHSLDDILKNFKIDFIIDAIDDVNGKIEIGKAATLNNIPFLMSMGMANKFNPSLIKIMRLDKTTQDPLAKKIRYEIKKNGLNTKDIMCVCSIESLSQNIERKKLSSVIFPPSGAGLNIAKYVFSYFINK